MRDIEKRQVFEYLTAFRGWWAKGTLKILHELLNHGGLGTVAQVGITYLTSKCLAGAASLFWVFSDRALNHVASCSRVPRSVKLQKILATKIFHRWISKSLTSFFPSPNSTIHPIMNHRDHTPSSFLPIPLFPPLPLLPP